MLWVVESTCSLVKGLDLMQLRQQEAGTDKSLHRVARDAVLDVVNGDVPGAGYHAVGRKAAGKVPHIEANAQILLCWLHMNVQSLCFCCDARRQLALGPHERCVVLSVNL